MEESFPDLNPGRYHILSRIGAGGMGEVHLAQDTTLDRRVALKILSRGLDDGEDRGRFLREGQLAASLSHPNCVYVFGTSEIQGFPVIAMELAPAGTLKELVVPGSPMPLAKAVDAILQVIAGLEAAIDEERRAEVLGDRAARNRGRDRRRVVGAGDVEGHSGRDAAAEIV